MSFGEQCIFHSASWATSAYYFPETIFRMLISVTNPKFPKNRDNQGSCIYEPQICKVKRQLLKIICWAQKSWLIKTIVNSWFIFICLLVFKLFSYVTVTFSSFSPQSDTLKNDSKMRGKVFRNFNRDHTCVAKKCCFPWRLFQ